MIIGVLQVELAIPGALSLKDKRRVVRSLKDRLHREHQVSVAEVERQDQPRVAVLGIVLAASDAAHAQGVLDRILNGLRRERDCVLHDHQCEMMHGF